MIGASGAHTVTLWMVEQSSENKEKESLKKPASSNSAFYEDGHTFVDFPCFLALKSQFHACRICPPIFVLV
jgi:hypothetical protein